MFDCLVLGDSVAVGIARYLPECHIEAVVGINATTWLVKHPDLYHSGPSMISLGKNPGPQDEVALRTIRSHMSGRVVWILPIRVRDIVKRIATEYGDAIVDITDGGAGPHRLHPTTSGYKKLAQEVRINLE